MSRQLLLLTTVLLTFSSPATASGQPRGLGSSEGRPADAAVRLEAQARALESDMSAWERAAVLYRRAAALRSVEDPLMVADLSRAGYLAYYLKSYEAALADFRFAADAAHYKGDVASAVDNYLNAAWVAVRAGDATVAASLLANARKLSSSPRLSAAQRREIRQKMGDDRPASRGR